MRPDQLLAIGTTAFVGYNSGVILWELGKPNSTECPKCAWTRIALGGALALGGLYLAFVAPRDGGKS
ncbi:MAG: hypothetical protein HC933_16320 [Pleurocapsa sp. SU_196_0]|nr:hypothetical protein [Pleurocapsa sp. SU_196_0]